MFLISIERFFHQSMIDLGREMSTDNPLLHEVEMKSSVQHSVHPKAEMYCDIRNCSPEEAHVKRQEYLAQIPIPWVAEKTLFNPGFLKSDGKIVKYDSKGLAIWRVSFLSHSVSNCR